MTFEQLLEKLSNPAKNALLHAGITSLEILKKTSDKELLKLHGFGPASLPLIHKVRENNNQ